MCVSLIDSSTKEYSFSLQWHITAKCDQKCGHCYMYDTPTYPSEIENELSYKDCTAIIDDFIHTLSFWNKKGTIFFTGGDPLLREDFFDILQYAYSKGIYPMGIMGNSYHINSQTAEKLKKFGVTMYQISLDGMRSTHDSLRKPSSFDDTLRAYEVLKKAGISPLCMFTVCRSNMNELLDVIRLAAHLELAAFDFDRLVPTGLGAKLQNQSISPLEYKELLLRVKEEYIRLRELGYKTQFGYKDSLWRLLLTKEEELRNIPFLPPGYEIKRGCLLGLAGLCVLSDGNVMACRRLPIVVGKLPKQKLTEIFKKAPILNELRHTSKIEKCGSCEYVESCKGCRAAAYANSRGDYFSQDPQCWI